MTFSKNIAPFSKCWKVVHRSIFLQKQIFFNNLNVIEVVLVGFFLIFFFTAENRIKQGPNALPCNLSRFNISFILHLLLQTFFQSLLNEAQAFLQLYILYRLNELLTSVHSLQSLMAATLRKSPITYLLYHGWERLLNRLRFFQKCWNVWLFFFLWVY